MKELLSRCPFVPGQKNFACPAVPKSCTVPSRWKPYFGQNLVFMPLVIHGDKKKLLSVPKFGGIRDEITITEIIGTCHHVELSLASKPNQHQQFSLKKSFEILQGQSLD